MTWWPILLGVFTLGLALALAMWLKRPDLSAPVNPALAETYKDL
jgi:hypothetical protein